MVRNMVMVAVLMAAAAPAGAVGMHDCVEAIHKQAEAWNRGDLAGFLAYYDDDADTVFVSGVNVEKGFAPIRARYQRRYGGSRETMGALAFSDLHLVSATPELAVVSGAWMVDQQGKRSSGRFTLVWKKRGGTWKIIYDHTSVAP